MVTVPAVLLCLGGAFFFLAGTIGLLRFPDAMSRIHALTKADNLGLGLIALALMATSGSVSTALKILLIWLVALAASSTICFLLGRNMRHLQKNSSSMGPIDPMGPIGPIGHIGPIATPSTNTRPHDPDPGL